ncbi:MAG: hypothetical protein ACFCA4_07050 [Cyanophyceae cyanobacterium]
MGDKQRVGQAHPVNALIKVAQAYPIQPEASTHGEREIIRHPAIASVDM